jgi:negative regulator of flagellin synthesis FlgM
MKIGSIENKVAVSPAAGERKAAPAGAASAGAAAEASAQVELSEGALLAAGSGDGVFDAEKVQRIAQAIRDGKFEINAEAIADKLIANAHELLAPKSSN